MVKNKSTKGAPQSAKILQICGQTHQLPQVIFAPPRLSVSKKKRKSYIINQNYAAINLYAFIILIWFKKKHQGHIIICGNSINLRIKTCIPTFTYEFYAFIIYKVSIHTFFFSLKMTIIV